MTYPTSKALLDGIRVGDNVSWDEFYRRYHNLIRAVGVAQKLSASECDELVQNVMLYFFQGSEHFQYDPSKGRFRSYLGKVIIHKAYDIMRKRSDFATLSDDDSEEELDEFSFKWIWDKEWRNYIFTRAMEVFKSEVDPRMYQIFQLHVLEDQSAVKVAEHFGITANSVYIIKSRALAKLKKIVKQISD